jgi:hypothetical protein
VSAFLLLLYGSQLWVDTRTDTELVSDADSSVYLNGHDRLERKLSAKGVRFTKNDNCFMWIEDMRKAQKLIGNYSTGHPAYLNWDDDIHRKKIGERAWPATEGLTRNSHQ